MNTLHQCHWSSQLHLSSHIHLIGPNDSLVIYGSFGIEDIQSIADFFAETNIIWYLVSQQPHENNNQLMIDHTQWLKLIIDHNNTYTWK